MTPPDITVLIPVHNRATMLAECLTSVRRQKTALGIQVLVVDDGSTDGSARVARHFGADVISHDGNRGLGAARNTGLAAAQAQWVAFLDSDDWWGPEHLSTLWNARAGVSLVATSALTTQRGRPRIVGNPYPWRLELRKPGDVLRPENVIAASATMIRREPALEVGGFAPRCYCEDLDLWVRVMSRARGRVLPQVTVGYRSHAGQMSNQPAMGVEFSRLLAELCSAGLLTSTTARAFATVTAWDGRPPRAAGPWLLAYLRSEAMDARHLVRLLGSRAAQRHRWRLQPGPVRALRQPPPPAPAAPTSRRG